MNGLTVGNGWYFNTDLTQRCEECNKAVGDSVILNTYNEKELCDSCYETAIENEEEE